MTLALRGRPTMVSIDARTDPRLGLDACARIKSDAYTAIVPVVVLTGAGKSAVTEALSAGADEAIRPDASPDEVAARLSTMLRRSDRDIQVHPSTRLPGTVSIESEIERRLASGVLFAVCYADLDHFKEIDDRYGYYEGDRIIRLLARILHEVVWGMCGGQWCAGHICVHEFIELVDVAGV